MRTKQASATGIVVVGLGISVNAWLETTSPSELQQQQSEQQQGDLNDSQENSDQKKQDDADALLNAEEDKKRIPGVPETDGKGSNLPKLPFPWK